MAKARTIDVVVRELCLAFPEAEGFTSHGSPNYRTPKGRTFATYLVNHHGDGRLALWLAMPPGAQEQHVAAQPKHFFVPPYVGPRGWLGVNLDKGLDWKRIAALVRTAYEHVSPPKLVAKLG
ncbi:MAG TPA: MmcQ/YjbR family DNA-binding protein, partial [Xanthomonadales bacterium]|nr:MmcQ/YjbR family DNA-binding protein [Xanthomonadales bacterium]